ncbi:MAG: CDP-glycerol glycerophosphotransferase family protein [Nitriliruptoraceae bacterium]|nr:CDP-glycerol glycerophosphotransferase family protein [Nitriliruptoraceae bacterium]
MPLARAVQVAARGTRIAAAHLLPHITEGLPLWVFGGASGRSYSDNARVTHERVIAEHPSVRPVWVIDPDAPDRRLVEPHGAIAERGSLEAHRIARSAQVIVFSHGIQDVPGLMTSNSALRVRLGHGLTAFGKTKGRTPRSVARMTNAIGLAPVASEMERAHKADWGFAHHQLPITGLARWDAMLAERDRAPARERPLVFYAPTSRPWHTEADASPEGALEPLHDLLRSPRLRAHLESGTFELAVYFHQITRYRFGSFDWLPDGVRVIDEEAILPHLIATASVVISDYSSILWDALYLDTPVILFQFDRAEHVGRRGSYLDLEQPLFGPNADTADQVLDAIDEAVDDGFRLTSWAGQREAWQERAFAYRDANNAVRIIAAIEERLHAS